MLSLGMILFRLGPETKDSIVSPSITSVYHTPSLPSGVLVPFLVFIARIFAYALAILIIIRSIGKVAAVEEVALTLETTGLVKISDSESRKLRRRFRRDLC